MIFETERLLIRKLNFKDLIDFHQLESSYNVLKYATGTVKALEENRLGLKELIYKYKMPNNKFWIYAIERKKDTSFLGTVALVKDGLDDEIGYRFIEKYWKKGYGSEVCKGLISYCKKIGKKKLIAYVIDENTASIKIIEKIGFNKVKTFVNEDKMLLETKYEILI